MKFVQMKSGAPMALHPYIENALRSAGATPPLHTFSMVEIRRMLKPTYDTGAAKAAMRSVQDAAFLGPRGEVPVRIYRPHGEGPFPAIMFFHGSGFCILDLDTHDGICRALAAASGAVVVSVDYGLAPEARYPSGPDDCLASLVWFSSVSRDFDVDPAHIALCGDSAGGWMALRTALSLRDCGAPRISALVLFYPVIDHYSAGHGSYSRFADGFGLTDAMMRYFWDSFLGGTDADPALLKLNCADLSGLPPTFIQVAEYDVLHDEGEMLALSLRDSGVSASGGKASGLNHGYLRLLGVIPEANERLEEACRWLRESAWGASSHRQKSE